MNRKSNISIFAGFFLGIFLVSLGTVRGAVSIGAVNNASTGYWVSNTGSSLTTGGISVGIFSGTPDWGTLKTLEANAAWAALVSAGFTDLRTFPGIS